MKKLASLLVIVVLFCTELFSQPVILKTERFDGSITDFTSNPALRWIKDSNYKVSTPYSMRGLIPSHLGDSVELISPWMDAGNYSHVLFSFKHICKVSASDIASIEYEIDRVGATWRKIPMSSYEGNTAQYKNQKFSQNSYADWKSMDSLARPTNTWWKTETFDLSAEVGWEKFRIKFKIKRGTTLGTQFAYGWLIDDFEIIAANAEIKLPVVEFLTPFIPDTVYTTGPYTINAKIASRTMAPVVTPVVYVSYTLNGVTTHDSIVMTDVDGGDSLWTANIPQKRYKTYVQYHIVGRDTGGNELTISSHYYIKRLVPSGGANQGMVESYTRVRSGGNVVIPFDITYDYNWSRQLIPASEFKGHAGLITSIGWAGYYDSYTGVAERKNVRVYFEEVDYNLLTTNAYIAPNMLTKAILVYSGDITLQNGYRPWNDIILQTPFELRPGKNLLVYVYDGSGFKCSGKNPSGTASYGFTHQTTVDNSAVYARTANGVGTFAKYGGHTRFGMLIGTADSNAVALMAIESPLQKEVAGNSIPVKVSILNNGFNDLTSCTINWSVNGLLQTPYSWTGNVADGFKDTAIVIGSYTPSSDSFDTVVVWVAMPNGVVDTINIYDDTLTTIVYGCTPPLSGDYIVGLSAGADFSSYDDVVYTIKNCGVSGDIVLKYQTGTYNPLTIDDLRTYLGTYTLTITSVSANYSDVIFEASTGYNYAIKLNEANNVVIKNVSIVNTSTAASNYALWIVGNTNNIDVINCHLKMDTTILNVSTSCVVFKTNVGVLHNARFIHNIIEGGYYGFNILAGTATNNYGRNIVVDSNVIFGQYVYATNFQYADFISLSYNTILSRTIQSNTTWYGLRTNYCNFKATANKIHQRISTLSVHYLAYLYYTDYNTGSRSVFSNNELIGGPSTGTSYGMNISNSALDVYNNSIALRGTGGSRAIQVTGSNVNITDFKNNNIMNFSTSATSYPIYVAALASYSGDYNNLYSTSNYVGYVGGNRATMVAWQTATSHDAHSVRLQPMFVGDSTQSLKLYDATGLECPVLSSVSEDIEGVVRAGSTAMGAYTFYPTQLNAAAAGAANWKTSSVILGDSSAVNIVIANMGEDSIVSLNVTWEHNGVKQSSVAWTGLLRTYEKDTVYMGVAYPHSGLNYFRAWVDSPNNDIDDNIYNDTCEFTVFCCDSLYQGNYTVGGSGATFADLDEAFASLERCGMAGTVTLLYASGTYGKLEFTKNVKVANSTNTITIASRTGNPDDVRFVVTSGSALTLNAVSNYYFRDLTFDASGASVGEAVYMLAGCDNIEIRNCKLLANPSSTDGNTYGFKKLQGGVCNNIRLIGNLISGGYYGLYLYGASTAVGGYNTNIYIDSNTIVDAYYYSVYYYYNDLNSFSYNKVYPRSGNNTHFNVYSYYSNHYRTVGNIFSAAKTNINYMYNYFYYTQHFNYTADALIANNEIIHSEKSTGGYGLYMAYTQGMVKIYNNTIYDPGSNAYGIYLQCNVGSGTFEVMNNNIWANNYPIYKTGTLATFVSDYNNLYSTGAYVGSYNSVNCASLTAWGNQSGDLTSVKVAPDFLDKTESLDLISNAGLTCPVLQGVTTDILGNTRNYTTVMGCYEFDPKTYDATPVQITSPAGKTLTAGVATPVNVDIKNQGLVTLTDVDVYWTVNDVAQTTYSWSGNASSMSIFNTNIGSFMPITGNNRIKIWTSMPNGYSDERSENDTIFMDFEACDSVLAGTYTLGTGGNFTDLKSLLSLINNCGIGGPVVIEMLPDKYDVMEFDGYIPGTDSVNTITFTSYRGDIDKVVIEAKSGTEATITIGGGAANLIFDKLTVNGCMERGAKVSIGFDLQVCENIVIKRCNINVNPDGDGMEFAYTGISSMGYNSLLYNVRIDSCTILGAQYGIAVEHPNTGEHQLFYVRDNYIKARHTCFYVMGGTHINDVSYNTFTMDSDSKESNTYLLNIVGKTRVSYDTARIIGNKFRFNVNPNGRDFANNLEVLAVIPTDAFIIANNEFYLPNNPAFTKSNILFSDDENIHFINNSLLSYVPNTFVLFQGGRGNGLIKNNNFAAMQGGAMMSFNSFNISESDYNNMYSKDFSLSAWKSVTGQDAHSTALIPYYVDTKIDLDLLDDGGMECFMDPLIFMDAKRTLRDSTTTMGAYQVTAKNNNVFPRELISPTVASIVGNKTPVEVIVYNAGLDSVFSMEVDWIVNGVRQPTIPWTGILAPKTFVNINLGTFIPIKGDNKITVYTSNPNRLPDAVPMNDTLHFVSTGCDSLLNGKYTVRSNAELNAIISALLTCGLNAPVEIVLAAGTYNPIDLRNVFIGTDSINTVTFTSEKDNPEDVVFKGGSPSLSLSNMSYVNFKALTFDASAYSENTVQFSGNCSDIEFYNCRILANSTTTSNTSIAVYKSNTGGNFNNIRFIKNYIDGGYYGFNIYGGVSQDNYGKNVIIDSNIIQNAYYYSAYFYYTEFASFSHNIITSRLTNTNTYWYGMTTYFCTHHAVNANKIYQRGITILYPYGMHIQGNASQFTSNAGLFTNNEIVLEGGTTGARYGFFMYDTKANLYHNSVYMKGGTTNARGVYLYGNGEVDIKNNIIVTPSGGHPIYMNTATQPISSDYNNLYGGGTYVGYLGANLALAAWRANTGQDFNSISVAPAFTMIDSIKLLLVSATGMNCPVQSLATTDIRGIGRYGMSVMGAYANLPASLDAAMVGVIDWNKSTVIGTSTVVKAVLMNVSTANTLRELTINWTVNGVARASYNWMGSLNQNETDTINLGNFNPRAANNEVVIWCSNPNGMKDLEPANDTIKVTTYGCDSLLQGVYTVGGTSADFSNMSEAVLALENCGVGGPVEFRLSKGTYGQLLLTKVFGSSSVNTITIVSADEDAGSVVFTGSPALKMSGVSNVNFRHVTFGNGTGSFGVTMTGKCDNTEFYHCAIQLSPTATTANTYAFYKPQGATCDDFRFIGNVVNGGYYGFYFFGQGTNKGGYNTNVRMDSNQFTNAYYYSYYIYYADLVSFSYNTITSRTTNAATTFYAYFIYANHNYTVGNKWNTTNSSTLTNIYNYLQYSHEYNYTGEGFFANNEIISNATNGYALSVVGGKINLLHNSIYSTGFSARTLQVQGYSGKIKVKNNQLIAENLPVEAYQISGLEFDHNNYYSNSGLLGTIDNIAYVNMSDWMAACKDSNAVSLIPSFVDIRNGLELHNYSGMSCPLLSNVLTDIQGLSRSSITTMGAYSIPVVEGYNLSISEITEPMLLSTIACYPDYSTIKAVLYNVGTLPIDLSVNPVTIHASVIGAMNFQVDTILSIGILEPLSKDTIKVTDLMPTNLTGQYDIAVWVSSVLDTLSFDDTAYSTYYVERVTLPYDTYFDSIPQEMAFEPIQGRVKWEVEVDSTGAILAPDYGHGRLAFKSSTGLGSMARAYIKQVDLQGTYKPMINFWYQHDNANPDKPDQTDIIVSLDGGNTFTCLYTVYRYDPQATVPQWKLHQVDLSTYINATCLIVGFEGQSYGGGDQFIDRVFFEVLQDLVVDEIRFPSELYACDLDNKPIEVIISNSTVYAVEMDKDTINLTVEITTPDSNTQIFVHQFSGKIPPMSSDTITVHTGFDFSNVGTYFITAYIDTIKITTDLSNDTLVRIINIYPDIEIAKIFDIGNRNSRDSVYAQVRVKNTGNLLARDIPLRLQINNANDIVEIMPIPLNPGDSIDYVFVQPFIVPNVNVTQPFYQISIESELSCDYDTSNNKVRLIPGVNIVDLILLSIENPTPAKCDTGLFDVYVKLQMYNSGDADLSDVKLYVVIDSAGVAFATISEVFSSVPMETRSYTFTTPYQVPNFDGTYNLQVFIEEVSGDLNLSNDTLSVEVCAVYNDVSVVGVDNTTWALGQNIPNPSVNQTRIPFNVPVAGEVTFELTTINGQVLHREKVQASTGSNYINFTTESLANGIYYYSMEYNGQRIVKKMTIQK